MASCCPGITRHFLLLTATPHNGKEEDFQLFLALLDPDRFEGRFRDGAHLADTSDLMRRMVKEALLTFDGAPLFPERIAHSVPYRLSDAESRLYEAVTSYVRDEFNRADTLRNDQRAGAVGFALTILQRRLASSPEAIYQSLRRRRERLRERLREAQGAASLTPEPALEIDFEDLDEAPEAEVAATEAAVMDAATAASTVAELQAEIATLETLQARAADLRQSGEDAKWRELAGPARQPARPPSRGGSGRSTRALSQQRRHFRRRRHLHATNWWCSPNIATRSPTCNAAPPRCSATKKPWWRFTAAWAARNAAAPRTYF